MPQEDYVVLVHGLGRTQWSLMVPFLRLRRAGFRPFGITYPSRRYPIQELARHVADRLPVDDRVKLHFLTHSLGGLIVRYLLYRSRPPQLGRVVMVAPPNQGSQLSARLQHNLLYRLLTGPAGQQLAASPQALTDLLGAVDYELGVIIGKRRKNWLLPDLPAPHDGKVTHQEAKVAGMKDFLVVSRGHAFIMNDVNVIDQAIHFFRHGKFARSG